MRVSLPRGRFSKFVLALGVALCLTGTVLMVFGKNLLEELDTAVILLLLLGGIGLIVRAFVGWGGAEVPYWEQ